ncbi:putative HlyD-like secretion protein [Candidatus Vecturithrix granuli]|uniref:Putative HlyD-like secretion protein n=1 Tax=Vecturithrix granuli TaxID=1499967 RepID=A0A081BU53_VECG1|nr:putative HlyD-like secretion protein [Candidatus Vecturithrix granuli]
MLKKLIVGSAIMIVAVAGGYVAYSFVSPDPGATNQTATLSRSIESIQEEQGIPVKVEAITPKDIELMQTFYGTVAPHAEAKVQGEYGGKLIFLKGKEGDSVTKGEVIVQFDASDTQLQIQQAMAGKNTAIQSVNQAQSNFETIQANAKRYEELFKDGFIARQQVDEVRNQVQAAQAGLSSAREQVKNTEAQIQLLQNMLKDLKIAAPISGVIDEKHFNLNEIPSSGDVIYHIIDIVQVYVEVEVPETYISKVREQMAVQVTFDSLNPEEQFSGTVERIIPTGNAQNRNFIAKVLVDNPEQRIKPGMFARINFCLERIEDVFVMNKKALLKEGDTYYVFKIVNNEAQKVIVDVKHRDGNMVAVFSDELSTQDRVITEGVRMVQPNDRVKVL